MKSIFVFFVCIFAAVLTLGATTVPRLAMASQTTFESPLPPWCEDNGGQQPCLPWRPTPMPLGAPASAPMGQSEGDQSPASQPDATPTVQPGTLPPVTLPVAGGDPSLVLISIGILLVGIGVMLVAFHGRRMVRVNLVALLEQVGPHVLGGDERLRLISIIRNIAPEQMVTIDLSRCAKK